MQNQPSLREAVDTYFEAKRLLFQDVPTFRLLDVGPLKCLHRHPGWAEADAFYALNVAPSKAVAAVRGYKPHANHMIEVFTSAPETLHAAYHGLGYEPMPGTQPFMGRSLAGLTPFGNQDAVRVRRTATAADYWIESDGQPVCWGRSVTTSLQAIYICGMETVTVYRRRGLASTILSRIHADATAQGAMQGVLCSSKLGLPLYIKAGYTVLAHMQGFVPH